MQEYAGRAAIGHVRYATCGQDDRSYAQPFERHHMQKHKWFSFAFNGQLANYGSSANNCSRDDDNHLARETDTEIIMHELSRELGRRCADRRLIDVMRNVARAVRRGLQPGVSQRAGRDARGPRPAGHQAAVLRHRRPAVRRGQRERGLVNLGFRPRTIQSLVPGQAIVDRRRPA